MPEAARLFRLDDDTGSGFELSCDAGGLALAGVPLLYRTAAGFAPRPRDELDLLLRHANQGREQPLALSASGLLAVAGALNRGDLAKAQLAAVFMRVPELDADSAMRLILADGALTKYSPDQPRDGQGRWTDGGGIASTPAADETAADTGDDDASRPNNPLLHQTAWTPPASRSPFPRGPRPAAPQFKAPGPSIDEIIGEGSPRDAVGAIEDYAGMLRDIDEIGVGMLARSMKVDRRYDDHLETYIFSDGVEREGKTFNDPDKTHFVWLPAYPDGTRLFGFRTPKGTNNPQWTANGNTWHDMKTDPLLIRP